MENPTESEIRELARANLFAAKVGLLSQEELVAWADEMIRTLPNPPYFLTTISLGDEAGLARLDRLDLVQDKPSDDDCRLLVVEVLQRIEDDRLSFDDLEGVVFKIVGYLDVNSPFRADLSWVSCELDLANIGIKNQRQSHPDVLEVLRKLAK